MCSEVVRVCVCVHSVCGITCIHACAHTHLNTCAHACAYTHDKFYLCNYYVRQIISDGNFNVRIGEMKSVGSVCGGKWRGGGGAMKSSTRFNLIVH